MVSNERPGTPCGAMPVPHQYVPYAAMAGEPAPAPDHHQWNDSGGCSEFSFSEVCLGVPLSTVTCSPERRA